MFTPHYSATLTSCYPLIFIPTLDLVPVVYVSVPALMLCSPFLCPLRLSVDQTGFCLLSARIQGWCYHTQLTFITFISVVCMFVYEGGGQKRADAPWALGVAGGS